jgi:hypothetical protein
MSRFNKILGLIKKGDKDEAIKALDEIVPTPENAVSLRGNDRAEYLDALDSIYGDQAKRAKDLGFDPETYYHGTASNFEKFNPDLYKRDAFNFFKDKNPTYLSKNPSDASDYAKEASEKINIDDKVNKFEQEFKQLPKEKQSSEDWTRGINQIYDAAIEGANSQVMPLKIRHSSIDYNNAEKLRKEGLTVPNYYDSVEDKAMKYVAVKNPEQIRSKFAAFDPRFKDSDLIMSLTDKASGGLSKLGNALSIPQRVASRKVAEALGIPSGKTSEETFQNMAQAGAEKLGDMTGIDPNSAPMNVAKSLGVAAGEVFGDPLNALPVAKVAQMAGKGVKILKNSDPLQTAITKLKKAQEAGETVGKQTGVDSRSFKQLIDLMRKKD